MRLHKIAFALCCAISTSVLAQDVVVFGDSLSDVGQKNWNKKATYFKADKTLNLLYAEHLAKHFGNELAASSNGGTNYAYSGGVIVGEHGSSIKTQPNLALAKQVQDYLASPVKKEALHVLWAGGNDLAKVLSTAATKPDAEKQPYVMQSVQAMAQTMAQQWASLRQAGIDTIIAPTIPNVVYTPAFFTQLGEVAGAQINGKSAGFLSKKEFVDIFNKASDSIMDSPTANAEELDAHRVKVLEKAAKDFYDSRWSVTKLLLAGIGYDSKGIANTLITAYQGILPQASLSTTLVNASITSALNQVGGNIVRIDAEGLFKDMIARPHAYGLTNTTGVVCKKSIATATDENCTPQNQEEADQKLFADSFHPGPVAHKAMADYIVNVLTAPKEMGALNHIAQHQVDLALDFARSESDRNRLARQTAQSLDSIVAYQKDKHGNHLYVGAKVQFNPAWQLAVLVGQQNQKVAQGQTHFESKSKVLSASLRYDAQHWWLGSTFQVNNSTFKTQRLNMIGMSTHQQSASPTSQSLSMALFTGYEWQWDKLGVALIADVSKTKTDIDPFAVRETGLMQMQFAQRETKSLKTGTGLAVRYQGESWQPYVNARFVKEWNQDPAIIKTTFNGSAFATTLSPEDKSWVNLQAGLQWKPLNSGFHTHISLQKDVGRKTHLSNTTFHAGVGLEF
ncbi:autotransporter domain-containing protein [Pasteurella sp. PK-2025]|uniref:autotransporter domain-containing protein n=1 Tax=Pasteurella sp. PK-2025 TaxID=3413133 RepID=UPI003C731046